MTTLRIMDGLTSDSPYAQLLDDLGNVSFEWRNPEWFRTARELGGNLDRQHPVLPILHDALHKYALRKGLLVQDGERFVTNQNHGT
jgi:hypothetical protein